MGHTSYINFPMQKGWKREHRLVIHPDFQGIGLGTRFQKVVANKLYSEGYTVICTTTTPALYKKLMKDDDWALYRHGVVKNNFKSLKGKEDNYNKNSQDRYTYSFCYKARKHKR